AFSAIVARARLAGARRLRCGCFGTKERSSALVLVRALAFTALAGVAAFGDELRPSRDALFLAALAALAVAVAVLAVLVLALYRQVGVLALRIGPRAALELAEEGPNVGAATPPLAGLSREGGVLVAFFSAGCRLCRELAPAVRALEREGLRVRIVYEEEEAEAFGDWNVPGSPFVVYALDGKVAAKGLVNTLEQLDDLVALGVARRQRAAA
ncbi:MAG: thioredoxin family protein, partial [Actinomycetota bacterium]|nr:thioredoxin family protein [Actinomycetota bacterium]